jgi:predicted transcriptional regulator
MVQQSSDRAEITIPAGQAAELDALAAAMDRSRDDVVHQAIEQYLAANAWQVERIKAGLAAAREGQTLPADEVFANISAKHGWSR